MRMHFLNTPFKVWSNQIYQNVEMAQLSKFHSNGVKAIIDINLTLNNAMFGLLGSNDASIDPSINIIDRNTDDNMITISLKQP